MAISNNPHQLVSRPEAGEVQIGELVVCTDLQTGAVTIQVSDRIFNVFEGTEFADLSRLGSLTVKDDKMAGRMLPGDQVVVDTSDWSIPREGGVFAMLLEDKTIHCRRLSLLDDGRVRLTHLNERYAAQDVTLAESELAIMRIAGRVKLLQGRL